jgi:hypothetical protein
MKTEGFFRNQARNVLQNFLQRVKSTPKTKSHGGLPRLIIFECLSYLQREDRISNWQAPVALFIIWDTEYREYTYERKSFMLRRKDETAINQ